MSPRRAIGISLSTWEAIALATGVVPPLTALLRRHPLLGIGATLWVAHHLLWPVPAFPQVEVNEG